MKDHRFPANIPHPPFGAQDVKDEWQELIWEGSTFFDAYLKKSAIETNHVKSTFLLTQGVHFFISSRPAQLMMVSISQSTQDLV